MYTLDLAVFQSSLLFKPFNLIIMLKVTPLIWKYLTWFFSFTSAGCDCSSVVVVVVVGGGKGVRESPLRKYTQMGPFMLNSIEVG